MPPTIETRGGAWHRGADCAIGAIALTGALLAGCGSSGGATATTSSATAPTAKAASGPVKVDIANYKFHPASVVVKTGTTITFTNTDSSEHTATDSDTPGFDTGTLNKGAAKTVTLSKAGTYKYICTFHPFMHGTIVVQ